MPDDVDVLITDLFGRRSDERPTRRPRSVTRLDGGVLAVDYGDEGHAFRLTVERVPRRRWCPERPVRLGLVDGVEASLVGVVVDNFVHVHLTAGETDERARLSRNFHEAFQRWAATARLTGDDPSDPPDQPARRLMRITTTVRDNLGTCYGFREGRSGGTGTEWEAVQSFGPRPAAGVEELHLTLQAPGAPAVVVPVAL